MSTAGFGLRPSLILKNMAKSMRDVGMMSGGKVDIAPEEMIQPPPGSPMAPAAAPREPATPQLPPAAIPPARSSGLVGNVGNWMQGVAKQVATPANGVPKTPGDAGYFEWVGSLEGASKPPTQPAAPYVPPGGGPPALPPDILSRGNAGVATGPLTPAEMDAFRKRGWTEEQLAEAQRQMSPKDQVAANQLPPSAIPSALPSAPQKTTIPQQYDGSQDVMVDFNEKMDVSDGQPDVPQSVEPSAEAPPRQPETAQPAPPPAAPPVPAGAIRPPGDNATYAERLAYANQELAKDSDNRDPIRAERDAAERRAIVEAAQARNAENRKRGVGRTPTDEQLEAHWRVQAAKGDKYARAVAIGHIQTIEARRAESLRRQELDTPVKVETVRQEGANTVETTKGGWQTRVAEIGADATVKEAKVKADSAIEVAMQNGDVATAVAALKSETDLIVGLANAAAKDGTVDEEDKLALKGYSSDLSSLQTELKQMEKPKPDDYDEGEKSSNYTTDLENYNDRMGELRKEIKKARDGLRGLIAKANKAPAPAGGAKPAGGGDDYAEGTTATLKDGRTVRKVGNKWVVEKQESVSK
jgi:hypothetical protein